MNDSNSDVEGRTIQTNAATGVLANDTDTDGDGLTVTSIGTFTGAFGTLVMAADGSYSYVADNTGAIDGVATGGHAVDAFSYSESDGHGGTANGILNITIDRPPVAVNDSNVDVEGATVTTTAATGEFSNDTDADGDALTVTNAGTYTGTFGTLTLNADGSYSYVASKTAAIDGAPANSKPTDVFVYTESDGHGGSASAVLSITIDRPPVAVSDTNADLEGATVTATAATGVLGNDTDPDGDTLTVTSTGNVVGSFGTLTLNADGSYSYAANNTAAINGAAAGSHPLDVFTYTESDGNGGTASATLSIQIDRPPVALNDSNSDVEGITIQTTAGTGVLSNDTDKDADGLTVTSAGTFTGTFGTLVMAADGSYSYVSDNTAAINAAPANSTPTDVFTYSESDGHGGTATGTLSIAILVPRITLAPIDGNDVINKANANGTVTLSGTTANVEDGQVVTIKILNAANAVVQTFATTVINNAWQEPITSAQAHLLSDGTYTFTADVSDQIGVAAATAHQTVVVDETSPTLVNDTQHGFAATRTITFTTAGQAELSNDTDPNADPLTVTGVSDTSHGAGTVGAPLVGALGTLTLNANGTYSYNANHGQALAEGQVANDVFTYAATDQQGNPGTATLTVTVVGHNNGVMDIDSYVAVESKTGDKIFGALYDNTGRYTVGSSVTAPGGPDNLGGTWTYTITNIGRADSFHQDARCLFGLRLRLQLLRRRYQQIIQHSVRTHRVQSGHLRQGVSAPMEQLPRF